MIDPDGTKPTAGGNPPAEVADGVIPTAGDADCDVLIGDRHSLLADLA
jgi:hypothetical protein